MNDLERIDAIISEIQALVGVLRNKRDALTASGQHEAAKAVKAELSKVLIIRYRILQKKWLLISNPAHLMGLASRLQEASARARHAVKQLTDLAEVLKRVSQVLQLATQLLKLVG